MDGKMKEQIHIITKFCLISFMAFFVFVFVSCKTKQKEEFLINQYQNYDMKKKKNLILSTLMRLYMNFIKQEIFQFLKNI